MVEVPSSETYVKVPSPLSTKVVTVSSMSVTVPSPEVWVAITWPSFRSSTEEAKSPRSILLVSPFSSIYIIWLTEGSKEIEVTVSQLSTISQSTKFVVLPSSSI